jgi:putative redox protein
MGAMSTMQATVRWMGPDGMSFLAETGSGHLVTMDGAPEGGGNNLAPRPMEMVLVGTGGCTAYDVVLILKRGRHDVRGCQVKLQAERAPADPKVFTKIHMHFVVTGRDLPDAASRAVVEQMRVDEVHHGQTATALGGVELPLPARLAMRLAAKVMTTTAHYL